MLNEKRTFSKKWRIVLLNRPCLGIGNSGDGGRYKESVKEAECNGNITYSCGK
jgi:hypothetical protein